MIQRIQSVYLLLVVAICMAMFFIPIYNVLNADNISKDYDNTMYLDLNLQKNAGGEMHNSSANNFILKGLDIVIILVSTGCLFMFNNRKRQLKISWIGLGVSLLFLASVWYSIISLRSTAQIDPNQTQHFLLGAFVPILLPILLYLTGRAISHDINLVKSADRLR